MKQNTAFFWTFLFMIGFSCAHAQQLVPTLDSLAVTFSIRNGKALDIHPDTSEGKASAQRSTADLLFILDHVFAAKQYRKSKPIQVKQHWVNTGVIEDGIVVDSVSSAVYEIEMPEAMPFNPQLKTGSFLKVKSRPSKAPEQFFISSLNNKRLILVCVRSFLYLDDKAFRLREHRVNAWLEWLLKKYH